MKEIVSLQSNDTIESSDSETEVVGRKSLLGIKSKQQKLKQKVLIVSSRGITYRYRHLLQDIHALLPHSKKDSKLDSKSNLDSLNEIAELQNCNNALYFETRKHQDHFLWMAKTPNGPSVKFQVFNVHTMDELKMTGNALKGSRPVLSFDANFVEPHMMLIKELLTQIFGTPEKSRKIKPFVDRVMSFSLLDGKIWVRNYQIVDEAESLVEIGPRFVMQVVRVFDGSMGGSTLYENPEYITPNNVRRLQVGKKVVKHMKRVDSKSKRAEKLATNRVAQDELSSVFK